MPKHRIEGYDGDYKTRNMVASSSGGHRIFTETGGGKKGLVEAIEKAEKWARSNPPQNNYGGQSPNLSIREVRANAINVVARWEVVNNAWKRAR